MTTITNLLDGDDGDINISQKHIHLWEDIIPSLKEKQMRSLEMPKEVILYKFSIKHALSVMGFDDRVLYPLLRINGYTSFNDELKGSIILIPETFSLDLALNALLKD